LATLTSSGGKQEIRLGELGTVISGRELGKAIREGIDVRAKEVVFDCEGIDSMTPSFADELFGKLSVQDERPENLKVANAGPEVLSVIRFALRERDPGRT
jgi:hypothetical protein